MPRINNKLSKIRFQQHKIQEGSTRLLQLAGLQWEGNEGNRMIRSDD